MDKLYIAFATSIIVTALIIYVIVKTGGDFNGKSNL